ncbi:DUF2889 domain-containing protein [Sphingomonas immobilis]|uniref:DUF2889 domain-containing protein n=1 Tax=Sphingomonas immobilis TaxID=3063997 RepID=A0ABT8ZWY9_9SPHN|nr:DUF2889 domain-containing protein [Sphingomonas sp. CA1-15]MDO7842064.1 DUF2889 domain-containing protein [Sphingomonas sp. CA1-15]
MIEVEPAARGLSLAGAPLPRFERAPSNPMGVSPLRRPGSVRRTSSIDATWPEGRDGVGVFAADARDILTPADGGAPVVLAQDHADVLADHRVIRSVASMPPRDGLDRLSGARAGGYLRAAIDEALPGERTNGTPLYLLLDDLAGATLVAGWAWSRWTEDWLSARTPEEVAAHMANMEGICIGFRPGSAALGLEGSPRPEQNATRVPPLVNPADPDGWHPLIDRGGVNFRRARRIDVWRQDGLVHIDSAFQDSASAPDGGDRIAVHEYRLLATADADATTLLSAQAIPGTLPYAECPAAPTNLAAMVGTPLAELRYAVLVTLRKTAGCTHLNDAMRALAEVPMLAASLA